MVKKILDNYSLTNSSHVFFLPEILPLPHSHPYTHLPKFSPFLPNVTTFLKPSGILPSKSKLSLILVTIAVFSAPVLKHYPFSKLLCRQTARTPEPCLWKYGFSLSFPWHPLVHPPEGSLRWWLKQVLGGQTQ